MVTRDNTADIRTDLPSATQSEGVDCVVQNTVLAPKQTRSVDRIAKRAFDIAVASVCLLILSPVFMIVAFLVRITSRGPLLYRQDRVGRDGHLFTIFKFRTMYVGADKSGPAVTSADDRRITPLGRTLRATKLDEIPQLLNVVRGDMSLVGPRPQVPQFVELFDPHLRAVVLRVRPGITGPTAIRFRHEEQLLANRPDRETYYIRQILPVKLEMDADYVNTRSMRHDVRILFDTARILAAGAFRLRPAAGSAEDAPRLTPMAGKQRTSRRPMVASDD
jgi:lipopolysaccharide/colanic/teichoic acid biosynthesis glycosyltransferase